MNFTSKDLSTLLRNAPRRARETLAPSTRRAQPRGMNKTEAAYSRHLELRKTAGELAWWGFEPFKIRLADRTYYTPDFLMVTAAGGYEVHETKGFMEDDAAVKLKVAAEHFPARFYLVRKVKDHWTHKAMRGLADTLLPSLADERKKEAAREQVRSRSKPARSGRSSHCQRKVLP